MRRITVLTFLMFTTACCMAQPFKGGGACPMAYDEASKTAVDLAFLLDGQEQQDVLQESADFQMTAVWIRTNDEANSYFCSVERLNQLKIVENDLKARLESERYSPQSSALQSLIKRTDRWLKR